MELGKDKWQQISNYNRKMNALTSEVLKSIADEF